MWDAGAVEATNQATSVAPLALPIKSSHYMMQLVDESALRRSDLSRAPTGREVAMSAGLFGSV